MVDWLLDHNDTQTLEELQAYIDAEPPALEYKRPTPLDMDLIKQEGKQDDELSLGLSSVGSIPITPQAFSPPPTITEVSSTLPVKQEAKGYVDGQGKGLTNFEIDNIMSKRNSYAGTIPSDQILPVIGSKMLKQKPDRKTSFIMNLDPSNMPGSHWVAVLIDPKKQRINYFDSFGRPPTDETKVDLKKLVAHYNVPFKLKWNQIKWQNVRTDTCGYHAMLFLENMLDGKSFPEASGFNQARRGEKNVRKFKKSLEPFQDI